MLRKKLFALVPGALLSLSGLASAATGLPWHSGFESGDTGEWNADRRGDIQIVTQDPQSGRYAARVPLTAGTLNDFFLGHHFGDHATVGGDKVEEVWLQMYSKFDSGYTWPSRQSHKMALFNLTDGNSWTRRYQVYLYVNPRGEYTIDHSDIDDWRFYGLSQNVGTPARVRFDQWDKLKMYVKLNTPGRADGIVRLWVNNQLKLEHTGLNLREGTSFGVNKVLLSSYTSHQSGGNGMQWYDNWIVSETDPDGAPPSPPVLRLSR